MEENIKFEENIIINFENKLLILINNNKYYNKYK